MLIEFSKFQSLGNDFILINKDSQDFFFDPNWISSLCNRKFGVGADGVIFYNKLGTDRFQMKFFNPDGSQAKLCGNGLRCLFLQTNAGEILTDAGRFLGRVDGEEVTIEFPYPKAKGPCSLSIEDKNVEFDLFDSGVEHAIVKVLDLESSDLATIAKKIRFHAHFKDGVNVNFIVKAPQTMIKTYERGVEDFTLACGTGALACFHSLNTDRARIFFSRERFCDFEKVADKIIMKAKAKKVFDGKIHLPILL